MSDCKKAPFSREEQKAMLDEIIKRLIKSNYIVDIKKLIEIIENPKNILTPVERRRIFYDMFCNFINNSILYSNKDDIDEFKHFIYDKLAKDYTDDDEYEYCEEDKPSSEKCEKDKAEERYDEEKEVIEYEKILSFKFERTMEKEKMEEELEEAKKENEILKKDNFTMKAKIWIFKSLLGDARIFHILKEEYPHLLKQLS